MSIEVTVNKVYALQGGNYTFRAYEVTWQGQDVIVDDPAANTTYEVGDTVTFMVMKRPYPDHTKPYGLLDFQIISNRSVIRPKRR